MIRINLIIFIAWLALQSLQAQEKPNLQQLHESLLKTTDSDTLKVNILADIALLYYQNHPDSTLIYAEKSLQLAQKQNYQVAVTRAYFLKGLAYQVKEEYQQAIIYYEELSKMLIHHQDLSLQSRAFNNLAIVYQEQGNLGKAMQIHQENLKIKEKLNDQQGISNVYNNIGNLYDIQGDYDQALIHHLKALKIREAIQDKNGLATSYLNIGNVYTMLQNPILAQENFEKSLKINELLNNHRRKALLLNNLASVYQKQDSLDKALSYYFQAFEINILLKAKEAQADNLNNIALIFSHKKEFDQAQKYFEQALGIIQEMGNHEKTAIFLNNMADNFKKQAQWEKAFLYAQQGYELAKSIPAKVIARNALKIMAAVKYAQKEGMAAYEFQNESFTYHDSIFNENSIRQINELTARYETEKKEKEIELLNKQQKINELALHEQTALTQKRQAEWVRLKQEKIAQEAEFARKQALKKLEIYQINQSKAIQKFDFERKEKEALANIQLLRKDNSLKASVIENEKLKNRNFILFTGLGVLLLSTITALVFLRQRQRLLLETERRLRENIIHQFDNLKNQISPHFLLNSLTALNTLIAKNPEQAQHFTRDMAKVYRHVLQLKDQLLVELKEELELSRAYISLQKMRFGENLKLSISICESKLRDNLPPLSLQLLLENAIKHNEISEAKPLQIHVMNESNFLIIRNNLQLKPEMEKAKEENSTYIGLKNLAERYRLVSEKKPFFGIQQNEYVVKLPLIAS